MRASLPRTLTTLSLVGLAVLPTGKALAASAPMVEYLNVTTDESGHVTYTEGDRVISGDRFLAAIEHLNADPAFTRGLAHERTVRSTLTWSTVGLVALVPALGTMFLINNQRNPSGTFTRTWLVATLADAAAAAGVGVWSVLRHMQPLYTPEQATNAAGAYNRKLDELDVSPTRR